MKCPICNDEDTIFVDDEVPTFWVCQNNHCFDERGELAAEEQCNCFFVLEEQDASSFHRTEEISNSSFQRPHCIFCAFPAELCHQQSEYCYIWFVNTEPWQKYQGHVIKDLPEGTQFHAWEETLCVGWMICAVCGLEGLCPGCLPRMSKTTKALEVWCEKHLSSSFLYWETSYK